MHLCCVEILSGFQSKFDFLRIFKVTQKLGQRPCTIVQGISSKITPSEIFVFIIFSDTYTCSYVVFKV